MALSYFDKFVGFHQLWVTNGQKVLHAVASFGDGAIQNLTTIGSRVFFSVKSAANGVELWTSDGTTAGTVMVKDINPGHGGSEPADLTNVNGTLYFEANDGVHGIELWKSDGTAPERRWSRTSTWDKATPSLTDLTNVNGTLYFEGQRRRSR